MAPGANDANGARREAVRLTTVYSGRVCQHGKAFACVISDVSLGGAKVLMKTVEDFSRISRSGEVQLIFERLSDYKALNTVVAWVKAGEHTLGLRFIDPELRRRVVIKRLMPNRWRVANEQNKNDEENPELGEN
jgi:c-di-GMP-binding flagellar brake protein YcgR